MMTIEQLDAVPIGGKVKTAHGLILGKEANLYWSSQSGDYYSPYIVAQMRDALSPLTDPQTWQDVARAQGWWVASTGRYAIRGTQTGEIVTIDSLVGSGFFVKHLGENLYDGVTLFDIDVALDCANSIAEDNGGWA